MKLAAAPETEPVALICPVTLWLPTKLLVEFSCGILVVSRLRVTLPLTPPPVRSVPALTAVIVPVPGKVCPEANVICPLLATDSPVSAGGLPADPNSGGGVSGARRGQSKNHSPVD